MDARNQSIPLEAIRSTDINKAIQRALTKACARHGLGLYIIDRYPFVLGCVIVERGYPFQKAFQ